MSSASTGSRPQRREGVPETDCTLADTLISNLPEQALRDILRSLSYLAPVHRAIEAYAASCQTSSPSQSSTQQRPIKRRILQPAFFSPTAPHPSHLPSPDELPFVHSLEDIHRQGSAHSTDHTETYARAESNAERTSPELRAAQENLQRLLILVRKVNVFYSHTLHAPDSVISLLNIANNAVDPQSIPIYSSAALSSAIFHPPELRPNPNPRKRVHPENDGSSSLPTPSGSPSFAMTEPHFRHQRYGDLIVNPSSTDSASLPQEYLELLADRILNSLAMMLIHHPRSKYQPKSKPDAPPCDDPTSTAEVVGDDCDLSDALLEMVYTLLDQSLYRKRPLAKQLSEFLIRIALDRERRFQSQQQQKQEQTQDVAKAGPVHREQDRYADDGGMERRESSQRRPPVVRLEADLGLGSR
ncbi:hypothetical protein BGZ72_001000 [Mortierella alpina]|nr:hypothetical protein BGZ72_001000 [Mortierella alpina]